MGIPLFFRWLVENYPKVLANGYSDKINFNNLYIDMNGVIHNAIKVDKSRGKYGLLYKEDIKAEDIKQSVYLRLDQMIKEINPSNLLYIGIDGVPPRAKGVEQRRRRFKSIKESKFNILTALKASKPYVSDEELAEIQSKVYDSNSISPATEFIGEINQWIKEYCETLSKENPSLTIILSDSSVPGEGEHKIMDYIRSNHSKLDNQNLTHCFYGMDADLIFLGLESHLPNFYILRDSLQLLECKSCDSKDHLSYDCKSAYAIKRSLIKKSSTILLRQIPTSCTEKDIKDLFSFYGEIKKIEIKKSNTKIPSLQAFVEFEDEETINLIGVSGLSFQINGRRVPIAIEFLDNPFITSDEDTIGGFSSTKDSNNNNNDDDGDDEVAVDKKKLKNTNTDEDNCENNQDEIVDENVPDNTVYIGGLDLLVSKFDIKTFFSRFGEIETFTLGKSPRFQKQQYCMIKYKNQESARSAIKSSGIEFFGSPAIIKKTAAKNLNSTSTSTATATASTATINSSSTSSNGTTATSTTTTTNTTPKKEKKNDPKKEELKELRRIENEEKCEKFLLMLDKDTPKEVATFYMGISGWDIDQAYENYIKFGKATLKSPSVKGFNNNLYDYVNLDAFKLYLEFYLLENVNQNHRGKVDFNRCINDITLLFTLLGNDFVPHLPSYLISFGSLELTLSWYKDWLSKSIDSIDLGKTDSIHYITNQDANKIIFENLIPFFEVLAKWESYQYPSFLKKQIIKNNKKESYSKPTTPVSTPVSTPTATPNTTPNATPTIVHTLKDLEINKTKSTTNNSPSSNNQQQSEDDIEYNDLTYYRVKLELQDKSDEEVKKVIDEMCYHYFLALHWILVYYTHGCPSWEWFYPYHYAPLAKDLLDYMKRLNEYSNRQLMENQFKFNSETKPIEPLIHLTSILPRNSREFLPKPLRSLMYQPSPIHKLYNEDCKIDMNGEFALWKGILLLPFMDYNSLIELAKPITDINSDQLTPEEKQRNQFGKNIKIRNSKIQILESNKLEAEKEIESNINKVEAPIQDFSELLFENVSLNDLRYPTRKVFTLSPYESDNGDFSSFTVIPTTQAPSSNRTEAPKLSDLQTQFLDWRKNVTGFNKSLELLESIDFSKCFCLNIDKKSISSDQSIEYYLGRLLNNEISSSNQIQLRSIDDSQMIINIGFRSPIKLNSIQFISNIGDENTTPNQIKLYVNPINSIDFSNQTSIKESQLIKFNSPNDLILFNNPLVLNPNIYKSVLNLTIFIDSNFSNNNNQISILEKIIIS